MNKFRNIIKWYLMFNKRFFKKTSFIALLLVIPLMVSATNLLMAEEKGMLNIGIYNDGNDKASKEMLDSILSKSGVLLYKEYSSREEVTEAVRNSEIDAAWIIEEDFAKRLYALSRGDEEAHPITVLEREETTPLRISHIQLVAELFKPLSYIMCEDFIYKKIATPEELSPEEIRKLYEYNENLKDVIAPEKIGTYANDNSPSTDYLTSPVRGLMSVMVVLSSLAGALYFLKDKASGKYQWLPEIKHFIPAVAMCLAASVLAALTVFITLLVSGFSTGIMRESLSMLLLILTSTVFGFIFCVIFKDAGKFGAVIPAIIIVLLTLSPIFFNPKILTPIRVLLPTQYYLNALYDPKYYLYGAVYIVLIFSLTLLFATFKSKYHFHTKK